MINHKNIYKLSQKGKISRKFVSLSSSIALYFAVGLFSVSHAQESVASPVELPIYKSLKLNMVEEGETLGEKFSIAHKAGFAGIEIDSPKFETAAIQEAMKASGIVVNGTVCTTHWKIRHSDPDPAVRAQALEDLLAAIRQTHAIGASSVLLVPGHGGDGSPEEVWNRSVENIKKAIPLAAELGVIIAIENVWNQFLYVHEGPDNQSAEEYVRYIDAFNSPWVAAHFDIGNHQKYGKPAEWIRALGKRIVKLDLKGWGKKNGWEAIGDGDIDWKSVREALNEIGYTGWAAAEVKKGDAEYLKGVSRQIDEALGIK